ncbi:MAG: type II toxin-antitoxin system VapC family toxin [Chloroflexi bacterium]|nr:type II toxin-antitoxin system VapC family toxin [Chloroflexota bacterium]
MFTIDASIQLNALNPSEVGSAESQAFLDVLQQRQVLIFSPTPLLVEVAAAVGRVISPGQGVALALSLRRWPTQEWAALDHSLAEAAARLGATYRLRGADAVYAAVAERYKITLVTLDGQQLERLSTRLSVKRPVDILSGWD